MATVAFMSQYCPAWSRQQSPVNTKLHTVTFMVSAKASARVATYIKTAIIATEHNTGAGSQRNPFSMIFLQLKKNIL